MKVRYACLISGCCSANEEAVCVVEPSIQIQFVQMLVKAEANMSLVSIEPSEVINSPPSVGKVPGNCLHRTNLLVCFSKVNMYLS